MSISFSPATNDNENFFLSNNFSPTALEQADQEMAEKGFSSSSTLSTLNDPISHYTNLSMSRNSFDASMDSSASWAMSDLMTTDPFPSPPQSNKTMDDPALPSNPLIFDVAEKSLPLPANPYAKSTFSNPPNNLSKLSSSDIPKTTSAADVSSRNSVPGLYSCTGFDMIGVLAKVAVRPNPQVSIGPVDMSCSFVVSDARNPKNPIVYISETFEKLTGYTASECVGRNCRFLQSPDGLVGDGSYRRYTDNATVYSMKQSLSEFKECQFTLINYRKGGEPFINLITIIPISWENEDEIAYFVGFQVDLVEQPYSIMNRMKDGTYVVNYKLSDSPISIPRAVTETRSYTQDLMNSNVVKVNSPFAVDLSTLTGISDPTEAEDIFFRALVEQIDFVHVLSLRGVFLYVSPDCKRILEYDEDDLIGHSLSEFCHPGDLVSVMRELKESSTGENPVNIVYRIRRKYSGYIWMESSGKCSQGERPKGKKFVVLTGREKPVSCLHKTDLDLAGGISEHDLWSKMSLDGLYLYCAPQSIPLLGFTPAELVGKSFLDFAHNRDLVQLSAAFAKVQQGQVVTLQHQLKNKKGEYILVRSSFFPGNTDVGFGVRFMLHKCTNRPQTDADSADPTLSSTGFVSGTMSPKIFSSSKIENESDDLFDVLSPVRCTSWQYELHQLRMQNRRLKKEMEDLENSSIEQTSKIRSR